MLTVVMYHYVRDLPNTRYPEIKALRTDEFDVQLDHIARTYEVVALEDVVRAAQGVAALPQDACLLTFDDGFADHYHNVFPRLRERGMSGAFFPPGLPVLDHVLLDVHKIHFILAASSDPSVVVARMLEQLDRLRAKHALPSAEQLRADCEQEDRYDTPEVMLIKGALQHGLPAEVRSELVGHLFTAFVAEDEVAFARDLYLNLEQLRELVEGGMALGGHGWAHEWLGLLPREQQAQEIRQTVGLLGRVHGAPPRDWTMCYPYGSYNGQTLDLLREHGATLGLTTKPGTVADLRQPLELARLDTNDLPPKAGADA